MALKTKIWQVIENNNFKIMLIINIAKVFIDKHRVLKNCFLLCLIKVYKLFVSIKQII
jgi:hypothetical protein